MKRDGREGEKEEVGEKEGGGMERTGVGGIGDRERRGV